MREPADLDVAQDVLGQVLGNLDPVGERKRIGIGA